MPRRQGSTHGSPLNGGATTSPRTRHARRHASASRRQLSADPGGARNVLHRSAPRDDGVLVDRSGGDVGWRRSRRGGGGWKRWPQTQEDGGSRDGPAAPPLLNS